MKVIYAAVSHNSLLFLRRVCVCAFSSPQYTWLITHIWILFFFYCISVWQCQLQVPNQSSHNVALGLCKHWCSGEVQKTRSAAAAVRMSSSWKEPWLHCKCRFRLASRMNSELLSLTLSSQRSPEMLFYFMFFFYSAIGFFLSPCFFGMAWLVHTPNALVSNLNYVNDLEHFFVLLCQMGGSIPPTHVKLTSKYYWLLSPPVAKRVGGLNGFHFTCHCISLVQHIWGYNLLYPPPQPFILLLPPLPPPWTQWYCPERLYSVFPHLP